MAQKMGLYVTHNHARPLGAEMFARVYPGHKPSYTENPRLFEKLWEDAAIKQKDKKTIFTLAFRGQGDRAFWEDSGEQTGERSCGELMSEIYRKQIEIIRKHIPDAVFCTNLYGEAVKLYKDGFLKIPDGVIKVWGDNGYGKMVSRRQMNDNPRIVSLPDDNSKSGVYYHCSFHDLQASNHLSMSPNSPEFMASELNHAYNLGASEYWIINCGSVLPHLYTLEYIAALWNNSALPKAQPWQTQWSEHTAEYGPNSDDRAGEQFWHHPVRELACALIKGKTAEALESLRWFSDKGFPDQITDYQRIAKKYAPAWKDFYTSNKAPQVSLYYFSAAGALAISNSFIKFLKGDIINAFIECGKAVEYYKNAVKALENESIGQWEGFFDNDCLTDVRLTVYVAESWMRYLRVLGDSPAFLEWEKKLLYSKGESVIYMLSATECPKSDNELWNAIK
ncbi:MAG: glycosyl hydrolase 115 family protein [Oscillospiraceae bacterium]|jgi:hypothetical protein|nr:glycosyl hydrolase 115 family protein [Oscillospiraceae bacterium]